MSHLQEINSHGDVAEPKDDLLVSGFIQKDIESVDIVHTILKFYTLWTHFHIGNSLEQSIQELPRGQCVTIQKQEQILPMGERMAICVDIYHRMDRKTPMMLKAVVRLLSPMEYSMNLSYAVVRNGILPKRIKSNPFSGRRFGLSSGRGLSKLQMIHLANRVRPFRMDVFLNIKKYECSEVKAKWVLQPAIYVQGYLKWLNAHPAIGDKSRSRRHHDGLIFNLKKNGERNEAVIMTVTQHRTMKNIYNVDFRAIMKLKSGKTLRSGICIDSATFRYPAICDCIESIEVSYQRSVIAK